MFYTIYKLTLNSSSSRFMFLQHVLQSILNAEVYFREEGYIKVNEELTEITFNIPIYNQLITSQLLEVICLLTVNQTNDLLSKQYDKPLDWNITTEVSLDTFLLSKKDAYIDKSGIFRDEEKLTEKLKDKSVNIISENNVPVPVLLNTTKINFTSVGQFLKYHRESLGLSQAYLFVYLGFKSSISYQRFESNIRKIPSIYINKLIEVLQLSQEDIITFKELLENTTTFTKIKESTLPESNTSFNNFGQMFKHHRLKIGLSQQELGIELGYKTNYSGQAIITKVENCKLVFPKIKLNKVVKLFNLSSKEHSEFVALWEKSKGDYEKTFQALKPVDLD